MSALMIPTERDGVFLQEVGRGSALFLEQPGSGRENLTMDTIVWDREAFVGRMSLHFFNTLPSVAMVSYEIAPRQRRQRYGTVALETISDYAFAELNLEKLVAAIQPGNTASEGLASMAQFEMVASHDICLMYERNAPKTANIR